MNNILRYKKNRQGIWQSSITTLPGSKLGLKETESTKSHRDKKSEAAPKRLDRLGQRKDSDASSVLSGWTQTTKNSGVREELKFRKQGLTVNNRSIANAPMAGKPSWHTKATLGKENQKAPVR
jgi:hypothetical protein